MRTATTYQKAPLRAVLATALALAAAPALAQQTFSSTVFFGDSLTDSGYFRPVLVGAAGPQAAVLGRFTTNPGLVWSEFVADYYGTRADANGNGQTGTNYAAGGARVGTDTTGALGPIPSLNTQVTRYLAATGGRADPNALYTVWGGANDIFAASAAPAQAQAIIGGAVTAQVGIVGRLQAAGARYVLVPTIPDIGLTPAFRAQGAAAAAGGTQLSTSYNTALFAGLAAGGFNAIPVDTFNLLREVAASPGQFGILNTTGTACQPQVTAQSLTCNPATYVRPDAAYTYLFADGVHPTTAAHQAIGDLVVNAIEGPRQVALLSHVASVGGRMRADMVSTQASRYEDAQDGARWWADARYDNQRYGPDSSADLYDGGGAALTVGVDWASSGFTYGVFGGFGSQRMDWGLRRGDFEQKDTGLGGYVSWRSGGAWANAQLGYSRIDYDLNRRVPLGAAVRRYESSTDGRNTTAALLGGYSFGDGAFRHGPIVGVVAQRIEIDGFAEERPGESTSLAYPDQDFDSLVGSAGWQLSYAFSERFTPYAKVTWDREFEDLPEQAFARSQSVAGSAPYAVPAAGFDQDYGTFTYGSRTELWGLEVITGSSITLGRKDGSDSSLFLTVRDTF